MASEASGQSASTPQAGSRRLLRLKVDPLPDGDWEVAEADVQACESCRVFMTFTDIPLDPGTYTIEVSSSDETESDGIRVNVGIRRGASQA